ncbi:hypothetical protein [Halobacteriovorax marinus]|uniref:hypothetical protein n=1 Tax=Halobacteriovorax marinus TaxID=97084 RepID=UPI003A8EE682
MKSIFLFFLILLTSNFASANEDFCFVGLENNKSLSIDKINKRMSCQTRDSLVVALQAGTLTIGTVTALCTWAPEPGLTKVSAAVLATTGLIVNYATFIMRNIPCNSTSERELNDYEKREFMEKMCRAIDKTFNPYSEKCE